MDRVGCEIEGCKRLAHGRGLCTTHYQRLRRHGDPQAEVPVETHGMAETPEYRAWVNLRRRCLDPLSSSYPRYGARGITVCDAWRESFETFYADMGPRPSPDHSVDRIDNDGPYSPENCRWATRSEQARNRRTNRLLTFDGRTLTVTEWAERIGVNREAIWHRLAQGWPIERVLGPYERVHSRVTEEAG